MPAWVAAAYVAEQAIGAALLDERVDLRELEDDAGALDRLRAGTLDSLDVLRTVHGRTSTVKRARARAAG